MHNETVNGIVTLVVLGAASQWFAWKLRIPSILVLLTVGFATVTRHTTLHTLHHSPPPPCRARLAALITPTLTATPACRA